MRRALPFVVYLLGLGLPATAHANAGIGFFMIAVPFLVMALVPAILLEAPILSRFLGESFARGLWLSLVANLASTFLGSCIAVAVDMALLGASGSSGLEMSRPAVLISLVPMFYVTWMMERSTIRRMQPAAASGSPERATLLANAVSYILLAIAVAFAPSEMVDAPSAQTRSRIVEAFAAMGAAKADIAEFHALHKRFPEAGELPLSVKYLQSLRRDRDGRVSGVINYPDFDAVHGKIVVMEPRVEGGAIVGWVCYTPDASYKFLPASCRNGPPER